MRFWHFRHFKRISAILIEGLKMRHLLFIPELMTQHQEEDWLPVASDLLECALTDKIPK